MASLRAIAHPQGRLSGYSKSVKRRKKYATASAVYRNRDEDYDATMNVVSGLVNLRTFDGIFQGTGLAI
jgi:hypothetical protein